MKNTIKDMFSKLYDIEPSTGLYSRINERISHFQTIQARRRVVIYGITGIFGFIALVPALQYVSAQMMNSGLYDYLSLFISDSSYLFNNWRIALLSVAESLPVMGIVLTLTASLISTYSIKKAMPYIRSSNLLLAKI